MQNNTEVRLMRDIEKLLEKYGSETVQSLAKRLLQRSNPDKASRIRQNEEESLMNYLEALRSTDSKKAELLNSFYIEQKSPADRIPIKELRAFAVRLGFEIAPASRKAFLNELIRKLAALSIKEIQNSLGQLPNYYRDNRSLQAWADVISQLNNKPKHQD